jgi:transcriptional regulator with XRE-family HTH domain
MDYYEFGNQVFAARRKLKISQAELAKRAEISRNYVSLIERGEAQNISVNIINQLATALGVSPSVLTGEEQVSTMIAPSLRDFALMEGLSFEVVDRLARIPRRGQEPQTPDEWKKLYLAIKPYLE